MIEGSRQWANVKRFGRGGHGHGLLSRSAGGVSGVGRLSILSLTVSRRGGMTIIGVIRVPGFVSTGSNIVWGISRFCVPIVICSRRAPIYYCTSDLLKTVLLWAVNNVSNSVNP